MDRSRICCDGPDISPAGISLVGPCHEISESLYVIL